MVRILLIAAIGVALSSPAAAQATNPGQDPAEASSAQPQDVRPADPASSWLFMQDGVVFGTYNKQGGARGSDEFISQNWWMGMASRSIGRATVTLTGMVSLEPATTKERGYAEIFQVGETYQQAPLVDYQHPHDFLMQLGMVFRIPFGGQSAARFVLAPVGETSFGPPAFMHRRSAAENPTAPLSHHTFDSSHITMGVVGAGLDLGPFSFDGSVFHGREPDESRWDLMDPGTLDSWATRIRFRRSGWDIQGSYAFLTNPEALELQDAKKSSASVSYTREGSGENYTALTFAAGRSRREFSLSEALLGEITHRIGWQTIYGRYEGIEVETEHLLSPGFVHTPHLGEVIDPLHALTVGGMTHLGRVWGWELGVGADVTTYKVPQRLQLSHGERPTSFHVFFRARFPKSAMGRMWSMTMTDGMRH
jgi:hypothetical protein